MTKTDEVLEFINKRGSITSWDAIRYLHYSRLSASIHTLRHERMTNIKSRTEVNKRTKKHYSRYYIDENRLPKLEGKNE